MDKYLNLFIKNVQHYAPNRSRADISEASGVSQAALSRIFSKEQAPSLETIIKVAEALHIEPAALITDRASKNIPSDILNLLENQPEIVYDTIRTMLNALNQQQKRKAKS